MATTSSLLNHHSVFYMSPSCPSVDQASYILLGEEHTKIAQRMRNAALIESLIKPDSVLLLEAVQSMHRLEGEPLARNMEDLQISEIAQKQLTCYGWDTLDHRQVVQSPIASEKFICKIEPNSTSTIFIERDFSQLKARKPVSTPELILLAQELNRRIKEEDLPDDVRLKFVLYANLLMDKIFHDRELSAPNRTKAMIETLEKVENLRVTSQIKGTIFLICGVGHLIPADSQGFPLNVEQLYPALEKLPSVVLVPKSHMLNKK